MKSVGFGIYKDKSKIKIETDKEIVRKKSKNPFGSGTIIIKRIAKTNPTTPKSVSSLKYLSEDFTLFISFHPYCIGKCIFFHNI